MSPIDVPILETASFRAADDADHVLTGVLLGENTGPDGHASWVLLADPGGWDDLAAMVSSPLMLNQRFWERIVDD